MIINVDFDGKIYSMIC